jgi:hypothetical protein
VANTAHRQVFGISVSLVITATLSMLLVGESMSQSTSGSKSTKTSAGNTTPPASLSPDEKEAQFHYKVALTALKNNDLEIAASELEKAAKLAPNNALVQYNLAVVKSKNNKPAEALVNLKKALEIGLPSVEAAQADDLLVRLTYEAQKTVTGRFSWLKGTWVGDFNTHVRFFPKSSFNLICFYPMAVTSTLAVASDPDHPDSLGATLTYHAQGFGNVTSRSSRPGRLKLVEGEHDDVCLAMFGQPGTFIEDATIIFKVLDKDHNNNALPDGQVIFDESYVKDCGKYCYSWDWPNGPGAGVEGMDFGHLDGAGEMRFKLVDDSHLEPAVYSVWCGNRRLTKR